MPYIPKASREKYDGFIDILVEDINCKGDLNYVISKICIGYLNKHKPISYGILSGVKGVLDDAKDEFYRVYMVPYEDKKRSENGEL